MSYVLSVFSGASFSPRCMGEYNSDSSSSSGITGWTPKEVSLRRLPSSLISDSSYMEKFEPCSLDKVCIWLLIWLFI